MIPRAVLFDFDGVIADTENVHVVAWQRTLVRMGWRMTDEVAARASEIDDRAWLADVFASKSIENGDLDGWCRMKQELTVEILSESPYVYPGVVELVRSLEGKTRLAVVTTTWRANVEAVLKAAKLTEAFELIVAKEDVSAVKPDPEAYKLALTKLRLKPEQAVAIEDSPGGIASAVGAGIQVLAVGHRRPTGDWHAGALGFVDALSGSADVRELLEKA